MSFANKQASDTWKRKFSDNVKVFDVCYVLANSRMRVSRTPASHRLRKRIGFGGVQFCFLRDLNHRNLHRQMKSEELELFLALNLSGL